MIANLADGNADFLQYLAFARQAAYDAGLFASNPFTTELQDGRFLLPLFTLLGTLGGALGGPLIAWIELARIPLLLVFFAVLWRFLAAFVGPARERALVCLCIGLSGGLEVLAKPLVPWLPAEAAAEFQQATWQMSGWSTFAAAYNPLWIALAIGCGSKPISWMNDSGFWVISRMSGLSEGEMLKTNTVMGCIMASVGLGVCILGATVLPLA